ncbi:McrBC 5-methylcytosine restriction system component [Candidatus Gugararchaeum adminiculabundum]|nr:McrBC 5-methylcytosine restriction system component [Candidatus Gugararchaeum adminiculabundum]
MGNKPVCQVVTVREYGPAQRVHQQNQELVKGDLDYTRDKLKKRLEVYPCADGEYEIKPSSFVGIVQLPSGMTIQVSQKVDSDLAEMLEYLQYREKIEEKIFFDPDVQVELPPGFHFFPLVVFLFSKEVKKILKIGLAKRYVTEEGNLRRLRGQIDFIKNEQSNFSDKSRIYCQYDELTYDILENQVILYCINRLMHRLPSWVKKSSRGFTTIQSELNRFAMDLSEQVSYKPVTLSELRRLPRNRLNQHYAFMLQLAQLIISENVYSSFRADDSEKNRVGVNFLVDMNWVFECFVSEIIREINSEEGWDKDGWEVLLQNKSSDLLVKAGSDMTPPKIMPDILLQNKAKGLCIPLDVKYKLQPGSSDYYQIICYSLAKTSDKCALIVANDKDDMWDNRKNPHFRLNPILHLNKELDVSIISVDLECQQKSTERDKCLLRDYVKKTLRVELNQLIQQSAS